MGSVDIGQLSEREFARVSDAVYQHCGINLHEGKRDLVQARIASRLRVTQMASASKYVDFALSDVEGDEFFNLIDSLSTNLTSFFRENQHFEFLSKQLLPEICKQKRAAGTNMIRGWSAGCSSGEEPYTIGMTLRESIPSFDQWDVKVLATDISTRVLRRASAGFYESSRLSDVPAPYRAKYFQAAELDGDKGFKPADGLRGLISFRYLNLMEPWPFKGPFDFIFCRNVMIYFDKPTQETLVNRFYDCLAPGGVLFTGHSESLTGVKHRFDYLQATIYRK